MSEKRNIDEHKDAQSDPRISPLERRIANSHGQLSAKRRELLQRILSSSNQTFFLSARQMAKRFDVNPATIIRTVQALGYAGFADFAEELRHHFVTHVTPHANLARSSQENLTIEDHVRNAIENDIANVGAVGANIDMQALVQAAGMINRAGRVLVAGDDLNFAQAFMLSWSLSFLGIDAEAVEASTLQLYKARKLGPSDILIAISFRRCLKATVNALMIARERGAKTIAITDSRLNPLGRRADIVFLASVEGISPAGSNAASSALMDALTIAIAHERGADPDAAIAVSDVEYAHGERWWTETDDPV
jgi:RpiR family transcriptional regulator, carbohydrate utilization regulator